MGISKREHHIEVLEHFLHDYKKWGEDLELEQTIEYAISSLKTDLKYDLMYEGEEIYTKADMLAMLEELKKEIEELQGKYSPYYDEASQHTSEVIRQKNKRTRRKSMKKRNRLMNRNYSVCADRAAGQTYRQIAENNNISITRVRQIISRWMAEYINKYKPLYLCNPELNKKCEKTSCQTDCFHTTNPDYSLDGKKYNIDLKTCEIREIPKGNE